MCACKYVYVCTLFWDGRGGVPRFCCSAIFWDGGGGGSEVQRFRGSEAPGLGFGSGSGGARSAQVDRAAEVGVLLGF